MTSWPFEDLSPFSIVTVCSVRGLLTNRPHGGRVPFWQLPWMSILNPGGAVGNCHYLGGPSTLIQLNLMNKLPWPISYTSFSPFSVHNKSFKFDPFGKIIVIRPGDSMETLGVQVPLLPSGTDRQWEGGSSVWPQRDPRTSWRWKRGSHDGWRSQLQPTFAGVTRDNVSINTTPSITRCRPSLPSHLRRSKTNKKVSISRPSSPPRNNI